MRMTKLRWLSLAVTAVTLVTLVPGTSLASPVNDMFANATALSGTRVNLNSLSNVGATKEAGEPSLPSDPGGASIWFSWTPVASGSTVITTAGSSIDTLLGVYLGVSVNALTTIAQNDDDPTQPVLTSRVTFNAVGGTKYMIAVDGYGGQAGAIQLHLFEGPPSTQRVSVLSNGTQGNRDSHHLSIDANGAVVAFDSKATNLVPGDVNNRADVFVNNALGGVISLVSDAFGLTTPGNGWSRGPSIDSDGNLVAFTSRATNLVSPASSGQQVFERNVTGATTSLVSQSSGSVQGNGRSRHPSVSSDGSVVAFESLATNLVAGDTNGRRDIFARNVLGGTTVRASVGPLGVQANGNSFSPVVSGNGQFVAFASDATNLVTGDTNGTTDVFVADLATSPPTVTLVSVATGGTQSNGSSFNPSISYDGRYIAFESNATNFQANDTNGASDVFVRDTLTQTTTRVSLGSTGVQGKAGSFHPSISSDGRFVAFDSFARNLVSGDTNEVRDVFIHDDLTGITSRVSVATDGSQGDHPSMAPSLSADGHTVAFASEADTLVPNDTNNRRDIFTRPVSYQPDALVKGPKDAGYVGDNVYNSAGTGETRLVKAKLGTTTTFSLQFQNDGSVTDSYLVKGCAKSKGFSVKYMAGASNVTAPVTAGTYALSLMVPDQQASLTYSVKVSTKAKIGTLKSCLITVTSATDATKIDGVGASIKVAK